MRAPDSYQAMVRHERNHETTRQDWAAALALAALFVVILAATWQRWTHPIIDHGREMNVPLRILLGERLYTDISYHYGPFAPYFNALLYSVFGVHLNTLHAAGAVCAVATLAMIYWLSRRLLPPWQAALPTALVLVSCALAGYIGNFIQPYAYAALYGWTFELASLACAVQFVASGRTVWMWWAGVGVGAAVACKPELLAQGAATIAVAWLLASVSERRWLWRALGAAALPAVVIVVVTYGAILVLVPWEMFVGETYTLVNQPQNLFFRQLLMGTLGWPSTGWAFISAAGLTLWGCGLAALLGLLLDQHAPSLVRREAWPSWLCLVAGTVLGLWGWNGARNFDISPLRCAALVLVVMMVVTAWLIWRQRQRSEPVQRHHQIVFLLAVWSLFAIGRVLLNMSLWSPYTLFTAPTVFVLYCFLFFDTAPAVLLAHARARTYATNIAMVLVAIWVASLAAEHVQSARYNSIEIQTPRARLLTDVTLAQPITEAVAFAAARTGPEDFVLNVPQGSIINFLADRRNPLREEILIPGMLSSEREAAAIARASARGVKLIFVANHLTPEYRDRTFGIQYNQAFMQWIETHYRPVATFSAFRGRELRFGDNEFFIRAYERVPE